MVILTDFGHSMGCYMYMTPKIINLFPACAVFGAHCWINSSGGELVCKDDIRKLNNTEIDLFIYKLNEN